jgi:hypothetical protein
VYLQDKKKKNEILFLDLQKTKFLIVIIILIFKECIFWSCQLARSKNGLLENQKVHFLELQNWIFLWGNPFFDLPLKFKMAN